MAVDELAECKNFVQAIINICYAALQNFCGRTTL